MSAERKEAEMREEYDFSKGIRGKYAGKLSHTIIHTGETRRWRNPSVRRLAAGHDPIEVIREKARALVLQGIDSQALKLPIDPFKLAELLSISVVPSQEAREAKTVKGAQNRPRIEYNPSRSPARIRFSICHEIAHTFFPDWMEQVRYRGDQGYHSSENSPSTHELETLCNIGAAELLLPIGSLEADMLGNYISIDKALELRTKYEASVEAVLFRLVGLSSSRFAVFAAKPEGQATSDSLRYRLEYVKSTANWELGLTRGDLLPKESRARHCTVLNTTAKGEEQWLPDGERLRVEMVAAKQYPEDQVLPRVIGIVRPIDVADEGTPCMEMLRGDALQPKGEGNKIVAHVVNDKTPNWGAGFGRALQLKWPKAQHHFKSVFEHRHGSKMGLTAISRVDEDVYTFQMVCQRGYGPSSSTKLRYEALRTCLAQLREAAAEQRASIHMPKIGTGEAGGSWGLISNLISEELCAKGVSVTVYTPIGSSTTQRKKQAGLFD